MHPILLQIGPVTIYTYGLLVATGFIVAMITVVRGAVREKLDPQTLFDFGFAVIVAAIAGSRIMYVIVEYRQYLDDPVKIFKIWEGGLVFYGGFIGAALTGIWFVRKHNLPTLKVADITAPAIALGHSIGRLGCFFAGCCYGRPSGGFFGIVFSDPRALAPLGVPLYPTQLFESALELSLFVLLTFMRDRKKFDGELITTWMILYAAGRFTIEFFRGDPRGSLLFLSTSQAVAIVIFIVGIVLRFRFASASNRSAGK